MSAKNIWIGRRASAGVQEYLRMSKCARRLCCERLDLDGVLPVLVLE